MSDLTQNVLLLGIACLAVWGAVDYIVDSVRIFSRSVRRYRDRHRD
jgi:hypothetical protein